MKCRDDHNSQELGTQKEHTSSKIKNKKKMKVKSKEELHDQTLKSFTCGVMTLALGSTPR
jgi:hypothetical protein